MKLSAMEKRLTANLQAIPVCYNCFLTDNGLALRVDSTHQTICKLNALSLKRYLYAGGCRVKVVENETIVIESGKALTAKQLDAVVQGLKIGNYAALVYEQLNTGRSIEIMDFVKVKPYQFMNAYKSRKKKILIKNF